MTDERIEAIQTRWSLIRNAHLAGQPESASEARRLLVLRYAPAIRRYLGGIVRNDEDADELSQDVMLRLMRGDFAGADPTRGRFRDLLKTAIRNMVKSSWQKAGRRKTVDAELDLVKLVAAGVRKFDDGDWFIVTERDGVAPTQVADRQGPARRARLPRPIVGDLGSDDAGGLSRRRTRQRSGQRNGTEGDGDDPR